MVERRRRVRFTPSRIFPGVTHEFFGMGVVVDDARNAVAFAVQNISRFVGEKPQ